MRTIKFRGRSGNLWAYGNLYIVEHEEYGDSAYIIGSGSTTMVDISTIGQFTGLHDKNGKEIYEGDIVSVKSDDNSLDIACIAWHEYLAQFYYKFKGDGSQSINDQKATIRDIMNYYEVEVIGNIYDNQK